MTTRKERSKMASELGRKGGKALVKKRGKSYMRELGRRAAKIRWAKKEQV